MVKGSSNQDPVAGELIRYVANTMFKRIFFILLFLITTGCVAKTAAPTMEGSFFPAKTTLTPSTVHDEKEISITLTPTAKPHSGDYEYIGVRQVHYSSDGNLLFAAGSNGIYIFDTKEYQLIKTINIESILLDIALSPDNQFITASTFDNIVTINISTEEILYSVDSSSYTIVPEHKVIYSKDGKLLLSGGYSPRDNIKIWNASNGRLLRIIEVVCYISSISISPDGMFWATTGSYDSCSTSIWGMDGNLIDDHGPFVSGGATGALAFSPNGNVLAEGSDTCRLWRVSENGSLDKIGEMYVEGPPLFDSMEFSPDGKLLAAGTSNGLYIWQIDKGALVHYLDTYNSRSGGIAWSPDGSILAIGTAEKGIELWDVDLGIKIRSINMNQLSKED